LICLSIVPAGSAKGLIPKRLIHEKQQFYENQISLEDKAFLKQLNTALLNLAKINEGTLMLFEASFPAGERHYKRVIKSIQSAAKKAGRRLTGRKKPMGLLENFLENYLPEDLQILQTMRSLTLDYSISEKITKYIDSESKNMVYSEGAYHYYSLCAESFEKSYDMNLLQLLRESAANYKYLGELARLHQIKEFKTTLDSSMGKTKSALDLIPGRIVNKIELSNLIWARETITNALNLYLDQLQLNNELDNALAKKFDEILVPQQARLPDLTVSSIEIVLPQKIKRGTIIKVIAEVKNEGNLTAEPSRILMTFPEGFKKARSLPKILPQTSVKVSWFYKVRRKGEHDFKATVNYDRRAWEANTNNNTTRRTLIIPHCNPR